MSARQVSISFCNEWLTHGIGNVLNELERIVNKISAEKKGQGSPLFDPWRLRINSSNGTTVLYPMPS